MSGIAGVVHARGRPVSGETLDAMARATPRPAECDLQTWRGEVAGLIRFPLVTTPEAVGETQPLCDPRSGAVIAFDGRIDNRDELRARTRAAAGLPDSALVLAAYLQLGDAFVEHLVGDYALAIWEPSSQRLFCARSPVGWRPLLWTRDDTRFAFATQPATLIHGLGLPKQLNEGAIGEYLASRFVSQTETFWRNVYRLPPGHALVRDDDGRVTTYCWHRGPFEDWSRRSDAEHVARFGELFDQALTAVMRSTGPVAAHLSGGLDSSSIVCRVNELVRGGRLDEDVSPIAVRFPGEISDEGEWIGAVEAHIGRVAETVEGAAFDEAVAAQWCAETLQLPLRPNTAGTIVAVCEHLRARGMHVLLTGEGGDDWLSGTFAHWPDLLVRGRWLQLARESLTATAGQSVPTRLKTPLARAVRPVVASSRRHQLLYPHLDMAGTVPEWITPAWAERNHLADRWRNAVAPPVQGFAQSQRYNVFALARRHVNVDNVLAFAATRGVELRHPLHDLRLTRFLMGAAGGMLRRGGTRKYLLREAMRGTLPELVRTRTSKANISAPIIDAVRGRSKQRPLRDLHCVAMGWVEAAALERYEAAHSTWRAQRTVDGVPALPYSPVWNAVAIDVWLEHAVGL